MMLIHRLIHALKGIGVRYRATKNLETREDLLLEAMLEPISRQIFDPFVLPVSDIDLESIDITSNISALRMDGLYSDGNLKQSIFWGLLILHILRGTISEKTQTLVDGGNVNSGLALGQLAERIGLKSHYVISHRFPNDIKAFVSNYVDRLREAPAKPGVSVEREFYGEILGLLRTQYSNGTAAGLWHAKFGLDVARVMGRLLASTEAFSGRNPSKLVTMVGSGASLVLLDSLRKSLGWNNAEIVVAEHEACSSIWSVLAEEETFTLTRTSITPKMRKFSEDFRGSTVHRAPHAILGPHYEEVNPYFVACAEARKFSEMVLVSDEYLAIAIGISKYLGLSAGNSSAVNLLVSADLAARGEEVLTFTYEPRRSYYNNSPFEKLVG